MDETRFEKLEPRYYKPDVDDRERMTERALAAIRRAGPAAALEKCRVLADQINAELLQRAQIEPLALEHLQAYLARANAVVKTCAAPKYAALDPSMPHAPLSSSRRLLRLVLDAFLRRLPAFLREH